jgi:hypothetical protein
MVSQERMCIMELVVTFNLPVVITDNFLLIRII